MHTLLDLRGPIPSFISITSGTVHNVNALDELPLEAGSYYMLDRGYIDFARLYLIPQSAAYFVTRSKDHPDYQVRESRTVDLATGLRADQSIRLCGPVTRELYPELLRRVSYTDPETGQNLVFLSNNFRLAALPIARRYRCRWQVELFFKWIKQNLRIKAFYGTSENAVKTQLWIAICVYVLLANVRKYLDLSQSLAEMVQILSLTLFEKTPILQVFSEAKMTNQQSDALNPLPLLDL